MLIYGNQLEIVGDDAFITSLKTVAGWLKEATGKHFTTEDLISGNEFEIDRMKVRTFKADAAYPKLYSILFSNPDANVRGRQWITEIGLRVEEHKPVYFTLMLETSEISTQVRETPVTTKPRLINYLKKNCEFSTDTIGLRFKTLSNDEADLTAFMYEIENRERLVPIVLLSCDKEGKAFVNPRTLQDHLVGLAQVVITDHEMDSWLMEKILTRRFSAWGGAINIIYPPNRMGMSRNRLLLSNALTEMRDADTNINLELLSHITHISNGFRKRQHFSPHDVRAKRSSDHRKFLQQKFSEAGNTLDYEKLLEEALSTIEDHDQIIGAMKDDFNEQIESEQMLVMELEDQIEEQEREINNMNYRLSSFSQAGTSNSKVDLEPSFIFDSVKNPTPENCLTLIERFFPDRIVILESAWRSADKSSSFRSGQKLADLFYRLCTDYYERISSGPETQAKQTFTDNEFAAKESETVRNSQELRSKREFVYNGETVAMYRHLKIGVADNVHDTIRVHFHWASDDGVIVIGYCGPHLPLS